MQIIMKASTQRVVIKGNRVIGSGDEHAVRNAILINGSIIEDIISADAVQAHVRIYDFAGHVIAPYLCDHHLHFRASAKDAFSGIAERLLAHGIGKAYDGGDAAGAGLDAKRQLRGTIDVVSAGQGLYKTGTYGMYIGRGVIGSEDAMRAIDALRSAGADYIKIVQSGIYDPETDKISAGGFERRELRKMIAYAQDKGVAVFCHANGATAIQDAVEEGASAIIHGLHVSDATLSEMQARHVWFIPTLQAFRSIGGHCRSTAVKKNLERAVDGHMATVSRAYEKGVKVLAGSDAGPHVIPYGTSFIEELRLMTTAGIPYDEVIRSASMGPLERAQQADFLVLEGLTVRHVVRGGKIFAQDQREEVDFW